jgi:DNA-binding MarR family transcriptional regulator
MAKLNDEVVELADRLHSAAIHLLRAVRVEDRAAGIGPAQLSALSVLVFGGSMSLGKLAVAEQVKPPTMVRIVQSLAKQGLVRTRADDSDGRKIEIAATARGRSLMLRARQRRVDALARALAEFSEAEQHQLRAALGVLKEVQARVRQRDRDDGS